MDPNREILSFEEKIALAELEEAKAHARVKELRYEKARFTIDMYMQEQKHKENAKP